MARSKAETAGAVLVASAALFVGIGKSAIANHVAPGPNTPSSATTLRHIVTSLFHGGTAEVMAKPVPLPGNFSATGRPEPPREEGQPIVFKETPAPDDWFYAYRIGHEPNFRGTVEDVMSEQLVLTNILPFHDAHAPLTAAHVDAAGVLVDSHTDRPVGFSH